jgi:hypothetical protein
VIAVPADQISEMMKMQQQLGQQMQQMQETFERKLKKMKRKNKELFKKVVENHLAAPGEMESSQTDMDPPTQEIGH